MTQPSWDSYFIQTGKGGMDQFEHALANTAGILKGVFENTTAPYSGLEPDLLETAINEIDLGSPPYPLKKQLLEQGI